MSYDRSHFDDALRQTATAAATLARYCDHVEHAEGADTALVAEAAATCRSVAVALANRLELDIIELYAARLDEGESRFVLGVVDGFDGGRQLRLAESWRDLQLIQGQHDRLYRPDVNGLPRAEQLRHVCLHLTKLLGALAVAEDDLVAFTTRALPDLCLLGVKMSTILGEPLPATPLPRAVLKPAPR
jgi:hypothetical protein